MAGVTAAKKPSEHGGFRKGAGRPKTSERDDAAAKIDRGILVKAQMVAKARKMTVAAYLSGLLKSSVDRDFLGEMKRIESGL